MEMTEKEKQNCLIYAMSKGGSATFYRKEDDGDSALVTLNTKYKKELIIDDKRIGEVSESEKSRIFNWIKEGINPTDLTPLFEYNSLRLKDILITQTGIQISENQFKDAMLECGFLPINDTDYHWVYCISKKSPILKQNIPIANDSALTNRLFAYYTGINKLKN